MAAAELHLSDQEIERLDAVSHVPLLYPWHQANTQPALLNHADLSLLRRHLPS